MSQMTKFACHATSSGTWFFFFVLFLSPLSIAGIYRCFAFGIWVKVHGWERPFWEIEPAAVEQPQADGKQAEATSSRKHANITPEITPTTSAHHAGWAEVAVNHPVYLYFSECCKLFLDRYK